MIGYKHLEKKWVEAFLLGQSIQLGSLSYYREMEWERADRTEGRQRNHIVGYVKKGDANARKLENHGVIQVNGEANFDLVVTNELPDYLIFCCSATPDFALARSKDLAIVKLDLVGFVSAILAAHPFLREADVAPVRYDKEVGNLGNGLRQIDPFQKPKDCDWEDEIRAFFTGFVSSDKTMILQVPEAARYMTLLEE